MTSPEPIYVGYLPLPARHRRFLLGTLAVLTMMVMIVGGLLAAAQRDPGPARWSADATSFEGTLMLIPYPVLLPDDEDHDPMLLVAEGKFGAAGLEPLDGTRVRVHGTLLERDSERMLEIPAGERPLPIEGTPREIATVESTQVSLHGEIVDSKCCLGAMKPGEGKTHRACATLCVRGGVPPILVSADRNGGAVYTLLTDESGNPANSLVLPVIAESVKITGRLSVQAGVRTLAIETIDR